MVPTLFVFVFAVAIISFAWVVVKRRTAKKQIQFEDLANRYQLEFFKTKSFFEGTKFQLKGKYNGNSIDIYENSKGSGKNKVRYTNIKMDCKSFGIVFTIGKENFLTRMGKWIGFNDIEFKDYELDRTFLFKCKEEDKFRTLMNHEILHELQRVSKSMKGAISYKDGELIYSMPLELFDETRKSQFEVIFPVLDKIAKVERLNY